MAERRMFAKTIVLSDAFLDMPMSSRCLYFTLGMLADDDGFVGNPKAIMRQCGASQDDMLTLIQKRFVLGFDTGVIVIKHWRINNYLKNDRHKDTNYKEELRSLMLDENKAYTENKGNVSSLDTKWIPSGYQVDTQDSIGKDSIGKDSIGENKARAHLYGEYSNVKLTQEEYAKLAEEIPQLDKLIDELSGYIKSTGKSYKSHYATLRNWYRRNQEKKPERKDTSYDLDKYSEKNMTQKLVYRRKDEVNGEEIL